MQRLRGLQLPRRQTVQDLAVARDDWDPLWSAPSAVCLESGTISANLMACIKNELLGILQRHVTKPQAVRVEQSVRRRHADSFSKSMSTARYKTGLHLLGNRREAQCSSPKTSPTWEGWPLELDGWGHPPTGGKLLVPSDLLHRNSNGSGRLLLTLWL